MNKEFKRIKFHASTGNFQPLNTGLQFTWTNNFGLGAGAGVNYLNSKKEFVMAVNPWCVPRNTEFVKTAGLHMFVRNQGVDPDDWTCAAMTPDINTVGFYFNKWLPAKAVTIVHLSGPSLDLSLDVCAGLVNSMGQTFGSTAQDVSQRLTFDSLMRAVGVVRVAGFNKSRPLRTFLFEWYPTFGSESFNQQYTTGGQLLYASNSFMLGMRSDHIKQYQVSVTTVIGYDCAIVDKTVDDKAIIQTPPDPNLRIKYLKKQAKAHYIYCTDEYVSIPAHFDRNSSLILDKRTWCAKDILTTPEKASEFIQC
jgi:hypothetical protein